MICLYRLIDHNCLRTVMYSFCCFIFLLYLGSRYWLDGCSAVCTCVLLYYAVTSYVLLYSLLYSLYFIAFTVFCCIGCICPIPPKRGSFLGLCLCCRGRHLLPVFAHKYEWRFSFIDWYPLVLNWYQYWLWVHDSIDTHWDTTRTPHGISLYSTW